MSEVHILVLSPNTTKTHTFIPHPLHNSVLSDNRILSGIFRPCSTLSLAPPPPHLICSYYSAQLWRQETGSFLYRILLKKAGVFYCFVVAGEDPMNGHLLHSKFNVFMCVCDNHLFKRPGSIATWLDCFLIFLNLPYSKHLPFFILLCFCFLCQMKLWNHLQCKTTHLR